MTTQQSNKILRISRISITSLKEMEPFSTIGLRDPIVLSLGLGDTTQTPHHSTTE